MRKERINLEIEIGYIALRFESFHDIQLEDLTSLNPCLHIQRMDWPLMKFLSKKFQKDASKENPRDAWMIELDEDLLNLLYI